MRCDRRDVKEGGMSRRSMDLSLEVLEVIVECAVDSTPQVGLGNSSFGNAREGTP
jgi:hypothetical protein